VSTLKRIRSSAGVLLISALALYAQLRPAVPVDPTKAILDAFQMYQVVALGEGSHGNEQAHRFRLALIRSPRFPSVVNDIVVESGSARHQDVMDRFIRGENVPADVLSRVWRDTTQPTEIWDVPIYEEIFRAVRVVNASLSRERQLRVVLGDPPVEWENIRTLADLNKFGDRDEHAVDVIRREVLQKNRRALVIYGDDHFIKKSRALGAGNGPPANIVGQLESAGTPVFVIHTEARLDLATLQADIKFWPKPSLTLVNGTTIGATEYEPGPRFLPRRIQDLFDAVLYLGSPSEITFSQLSPVLCSDTAYMQMRLGRAELLRPPPQAPPGTLGAADRLRQYCAGITSR
jgi:hypothetical protein